MTKNKLFRTASIFLNKEISKLMFYAFFSLQLIIFSLFLYTFNSIDYLIKYDLFGGYFGLAYYFLILPILILFMKIIEVFTGIALYSSGNEGVKFIIWTIPFYLLICLLWVFCRRKRPLTVKYLLQSISITWLLLFTTGIVFFHSELAF